MTLLQSSNVLIIIVFLNQLLSVLHQHHMVHEQQPE